MPLRASPDFRIETSARGRRRAPRPRRRPRAEERPAVRRRQRPGRRQRPALPAGRRRPAHRHRGPGRALPSHPRQHGRPPEGLLGADGPAPLHRQAARPRRVRSRRDRRHGVDRRGDAAVPGADSGGVTRRPGARDPGSKRIRSLRSGSCRRQPALAHRVARNSHGATGRGSDQSPTRVSRACRSSRASVSSFEYWV